jgi:hypothetical protein
MASDTEVGFDATMRNHQFYRFIEMKEPKEETYRTHHTLNTCGHMTFPLTAVVSFGLNWPELK